MSIGRHFPNTFSFIGAGLRRPECVVATSAGEVLTSDWRGGISIVRPPGEVETRLAGESPIVLRPNGIAVA